MEAADVKDARKERFFTDGDEEYLTSDVIIVVSRCVAEVSKVVT
jgi:hypothetical protein